MLAFTGLISWLGAWDTPIWKIPKGSSIYHDGHVWVSMCALLPNIKCLYNPFCLSRMSVKSQCYIVRYTVVWSRYRESEIHDIHEIGSGTKLLFTFLSLKVIRHEERETQSFYADCFYIVSSQPNQRAAPVAHKVVWPRQALNLDSLVRRQELNSLLFLKSQKSSAHASSEWRHSPPWSHFLSGVLFWHLWMTHPPRAHVNTRAHVCT